MTETQTFKMTKKSRLPCHFTPPSNSAGRRNDGKEGRLPRTFQILAMTIFIGIAVLTFVMTKGVEAANGCPVGQDCWGTRTFNSSYCVNNDGDTCDDSCGACANIPGESCNPALSNQCVTGDYGETGQCNAVCCDDPVPTFSCVNVSFNSSCTASANNCSADAVVSTCSLTDGGCSDPQSTDSAGCCGPGESHSECSGGACVVVDGGGANTCSNSADCDIGGDDGGGGDPTHLECVGLSCQTVAGDAANTCSSSADCNPSYSVSGNVYLDNTGACSSTATPVEPGSGAQVTIPGEVIGDIGGAGSYSIANVDTGVQVVTLSGMDTEYQCCSPASCQSSVNVSGNTTVNYFVTSERNPWWQTSGGDVGANLGSLSSSIPSSCVIGLCYPFMSRGASDSSGILSYFSGTTGFGDGGTASEGTDFVAESALRTTTRKEGYNYFFRLFEMGLSPVDDFAVKTSVNKPSVGPSNGRAYYSGGTLTLNASDWTIAPGESMVVFVDGNLAVEVNMDVPVSAFLAFVVSGDITFTTGTATHASETALVEGVYIADGVLQTNTGTDKFVGEGTFVGWSGVVLNRDFDSTDNNLNPAEYFIYRPDFVINAPARMKRPVIRWEEIAP